MTISNIEYEYEYEEEEEEYEYEENLTRGAPSEVPSCLLPLDFARPLPYD